MRGQPLFGRRGLRGVQLFSISQPTPHACLVCAGASELASIGPLLPEVGGAPNVCHRHKDQQPANPSMQFAEVAAAAAAAAGRAGLRKPGGAG